MVLASDVSADRWRGSVSLFKRARSTKPFAEHVSLSWIDFVKIVAPEKLSLVAAKEEGPFFLPTALRDAPLVGATLERAHAHRLPLVGKMRSATHVTNGTALKLDLDGIEKCELAASLDTLKRNRLAFVIYSTHSHGLKPKIRARLILPIDRPATPEEYRRISHAISEALLGKTLDKSEGYLHQLAGTFVAHPSRATSALRLEQGEGFCISSSASLAATTQEAPRCTDQKISKPVAAPASSRDWSRMLRAVEQLDANDFQTWRTVGMMLKALETDDRARELWFRFTEQAAGASKKRNHEACYDPQIMWDRFSPCVPAEVAFATILARAREAAAVKGQKDLERGFIGGRGEEALAYLARYHNEFFECLVADCERSRAGGL